MKERARFYREAMRHPGLLHAATVGAARYAFYVGVPQSEELLALVAEDILSLERLLVPEAAAMLATSYDWFFRTLLELHEAGYEVDVQGLRRRIVTLAQDKLPRLREPRRREYLQGVIDHLSGAAARDELLNHPAPEITFLWSSDPNITTLQDLRGSPRRARVLGDVVWPVRCGYSEQARVAAAL